MIVQRFDLKLIHMLKVIILLVLPVAWYMLSISLIDLDSPLTSEVKFARTLSFTPFYFICLPLLVTCYMNDICQTFCVVFDDILLVVIIIISVLFICFVGAENIL